MSRIEELKKYYMDKQFAIIGLNDSQGVNTTSTFFKKGLLEYIAAALQDEFLKPIVINAFSLTLNKTEHIDSFFNANLSLEEIKLSQVYSVVSALEKLMQDIKLPKFIGKIGYVYKTIYKVKDEDKKIFITDTLRDSEEPIVIYSSGVNNLMREVASNPFAIKSQYNNRDKNPSYYYILEKSKNPKTLKMVIDGIEKNFDTIFGINCKSDVYALGAYIPKSLEFEGMNVFRDLVLRYNELLIELCEAYNVEFIDTENIGKEYNQSSTNFHVTTEGHNALANHILSKMYDKKINVKDNLDIEPKSKLIITNKGPKEMMEEYSRYYIELCNRQLEEQDPFIKKRTEEVADERRREANIMCKVNKKSSRNI